jgi:hypothetical protein
MVRAVVRRYRPDWALERQVTLLEAPKGGPREGVVQPYKTDDPGAALLNGILYVWVVRLSSGLGTPANGFALYGLDPWTLDVILDDGAGGPLIIENPRQAPFAGVMDFIDGEYRLLTNPRDPGSPFDQDGLVDYRYDDQWGFLGQVVAEHPFGENRPAYATGRIRYGQEYEAWGFTVTPPDTGQENGAIGEAWLRLSGPGGATYLKVSELDNTRHTEIGIHNDKAYVAYFHVTEPRAVTVRRYRIPSTPVSALSPASVVVLNLPETASNPEEEGHRFTCTRPTARDFVICDDLGGTFQAVDWSDWSAFAPMYQALERAYFQAHPSDDAAFLIALGTEAVTKAGGRHRTLAQRESGIGMDNPCLFFDVARELGPRTRPPRADPTDWDGTPHSRVQGLVNLQLWTQYVYDERLNLTRLTKHLAQELGHQWLARSHFRNALERRSAALLGNECTHWSFYLQTGRSPLEGLDWIEDRDGTFTATRKPVGDPKPYDYTFNDLELYLMGLLPPEAVSPWFLVDVPRDARCTIDGVSDQPCPSPAERSSYGFRTITVPGKRVDITIEDVIAADGPRRPAFGEAPTEFGVSFLLIKAPEEQLNPAQLDSINEIVLTSVALWTQVTRGHGSLINRTR